MASVVLVWLIGLTLIFAEFYVPGGILAIIGSAVILISLWMGYQLIPSVFLFILWSLVVVASIAGVVRFATLRLKNAAEGTRLSSANQEGYVASSYEKELIGKTLYTASNLRPAGWVEYEGQRFTAISDSGFVEKGCQVVVIRGEGPDLIVRPVNEYSDRSM